MEKNLAKTSRELRKLDVRVKKLKVRLKETIEPKKKQMLTNKLNDLFAQIGEVHLDRQEYEKARSIYNSPPWKTHGEQRYCGITRELIDNEKYKEAREVLDKALEKYPESSSLLNSMGLLFYRTNNQYEALRYFDRALAIRTSDNAPMLYNKALSLNLLGYFEESYKILSELLEKFPDEPYYFVEMGDIAVCKEMSNGWRLTVTGQQSNWVLNQPMSMAGFVVHV